MGKIIVNVKVIGILFGYILFYTVLFFFEPQIIVIKEHVRRVKGKKTLDIYR